MSKLGIKKNSKPTPVSFNINTKRFGYDDFYHGRSFYVGAFVFCVLGKPGEPLVYPDPLDLAQWEFYVLMSKVLDDEVGDQKTIRLRPLRELVKHKGRKADFDGLSVAIEESFELYPLEGGDFLGSLIRSSRATRYSMPRTTARCRRL